MAHLDHTLDYDLDGDGKVSAADVATAKLIQDQEDAARKFEGESWARDEAKRQEASRRGMISEDRRGASLRQAERELEQTYDTVAAFAVTVDANKAIVDVSQVFHIEERQVLLTHVPLGFEDDKGLKRTRGPGSGLTNGDEARDRIYRLEQEEKAREQAEADARRARIERARQRKLEADRQKVRDGRAQRVRANQDEVARVEAPAPPRGRRRGRTGSRSSCRARCLPRYRRWEQRK